MIQMVITALLPVSLVTNITVEALKKLLKDKKYSSNALAISVAIVVSLIVSIGYMCLKHLPFNFEAVATILVLVWASFIMATCGYDKIIQLLKQLRDSK